MSLSLILFAGLPTLLLFLAVGRPSPAGRRDRGGDPVAVLARHPRD